MEFNRPVRTHELAELARAMEIDSDPVEHVHALGRTIGLPASLAEIGVAEARPARHGRGVDRHQAPDLEQPARARTWTALEAILSAAWHGDPARLSAVPA